jgi:hypothetical protein
MRLRLLFLSATFAACSTAYSCSTRPNAGVASGTDSSSEPPDGGSDESASDATPAFLVPTIDSTPWQIAGEPDLGALNAPGQQPVDFAIWQAADGTWQLWSCIRFTKEPGNTRVFYAWEGRNLTDSNWTPKGIVMHADPTYGETPGGLQAPYVFLVGSTYHMVYGDWQHIDHQTSMDGKTFTRVVQPGGSAAMFSEGLDNGTRDPMVLPIGGTYYAYYTANPAGLGGDYVRTSPDLAAWSDSTKIAYGGEAGTGGSSAECPFVVYIEGAYYLFRTQHYGVPPETRVYRSLDPHDFGVNDDSHLVEILPVAAPEIHEYKGQWYIAWLLDGLQGIQIAKLAWNPR